MRKRALVEKDRLELILSESNRSARPESKHEYGDKQDRSIRRYRYGGGERRLENIELNGVGYGIEPLLRLQRLPTFQSSWYRLATTS